MVGKNIPNPKKQKPAKKILAWLALSPLLIFAVSFQVIPILTLSNTSLITKTGITFQYFTKAFTPVILNSFGNSLRLSFATAFLGVALGLFVALAIISSPKKIIRDALTALSDVTTNFGGAPLAFAFIITLGSTGVITLILKAIGVNLYPQFRIYSITGLTIAYLYFQLPLMIPFNHPVNSRPKNGMVGGGNQSWCK